LHISFSSRGESGALNGLFWQSLSCLIWQGMAEVTIIVAASLTGREIKQRIKNRFKKSLHSLLIQQFSSTEITK
jgi:hypothetical protein